MALLELEHVCKRFREGAHEIEVLRDVCLELHEHELVAIWGQRGSGRSTLLRIIAGIEAPDEGIVRFAGRDPAGAGAIAHGIAYCNPGLGGLGADAVLEALISVQVARGVRPTHASEGAVRALERVGAPHCERRCTSELAQGDVVRVSIARALLQEPSLLLVDGPTTGVEVVEQDEIVWLLRSLTREVAILMSIDTGVGMFVADRTLSLGEGRLRGHVAPEVAQVVELPLRASA